MTSKSKNKGNALEREMRDYLNAAYQTEEFARTPSSGAIMGLSNYERNQGLSEATQATLGSDLICPEWFKFSVECKSYADTPNYAKIIKEPDTDLNGWLGETCFDARNFGLNPLLFFKTNRKGIHAALPVHFLPELHLEHYLVYDQFVIMGCDAFFLNAENVKRAGIDLLRMTSEWLNRHEAVNQLIVTMQIKKAKKPKRKSRANA